MATLDDIAHRGRARLRHARVLAVAVAASIAVHIALVLGLPGMSVRDAGRVEVLEVTLAKQEPPRVLATAPPAMRERPKEDRSTRLPSEKPARAIAQPERAAAPPQTPAQRQSLALQRQPSEAEPTLTVPIFASELPSAESPRRHPPAVAPAPQTAGRDVAKASPAVSASLEPKVTPPNFNAGYLRNPPPRYPWLARRNGEQGTVTLKVLVSREGLPSSISVQTTSGWVSLDQAAIEAVKGWRFAPARQGPQAVEAWVLVPIVFKLEGVS